MLSALGRVNKKTSLWAHYTTCWESILKTSKDTRVQILINYSQLEVVEVAKDGLQLSHYSSKATTVHIF